MDQPDQKLRAAVRLILNLLADQQYVALANLTASGAEHLNPEDIARAIQLYPGTVRMPTESELTFDAVPVEGSDPPQYAVDACVFTIEEGKSDLTARMTVIDKPGDDFEVIYYDTWVM